MIVRGMDGTFYEIPDDKTEEYKIPAAEVREKLAATSLPDAPMGFQNVNMPSAGGTPQVAINIITQGAPQMGAPGQPTGGPVTEEEARAAAAAAPTAPCYSCYYCYSCYCYSCYCYRTCYSCYVQPV